MITPTGFDTIHERDKQQFCCHSKLLEFIRIYTVEYGVRKFLRFCSWSTTLHHVYYRYGDYYHSQYPYFISLLEP